MFKHPPTHANDNPQAFETDGAPILPKWLIKLCRPQRMLWLAPLIGFMLSVPSIFSGYTADDHIYRQQTIDNSAYQKRAVWDYFNWVSSDSEAAAYRERGIFVDWWLPDAFRFHLFRPLASLVHAFEFRFFKNAPWVMHLGLALLYALLIILCAKLLMRFSLSPAACGTGILLFAIDDTHSYSSGWISSYNTILCCVFGYFALLMHDRWRRHKSTGGLILSIATFILALLSSEGGLALMGYLFSYALFLDSGTWWKKARSLAPASIIAAGYLLFYTIMGFGVKGMVGSYYLSPFENPLNTIVAILSNTALFTMSQILSIPPLTLILQFLPAGLIIAAVLLFVIIGIHLKFIISNKTIAFFGTGMVLSIVPFTIGFPGDRVLLWAGLGASGLLGELFGSSTAASGKLQKASAKTLLVFNTVFSLIFFIPVYMFLTSIERNAKSLEQIITNQTTVVFNTPDGFAATYAPALKYANGGEWPEHYYSFYCGDDTLTVKRTGERTFSATLANGWFGENYEKTKRSKLLYFKHGDTVNLQLMTVTVVATTPDARPLRVQFSFKRDLTEFAWVKWTEKGPEKCGVPGIGEEMRLVASVF